MMGRIIIMVFFALALGITAEAQVSVGIYQNGVLVTLE